MRLIIPLVILMIFLSSVSADVILKQQPDSVYNLGDTIGVPVKVKTNVAVQGPFRINLLCNGIETEAYKEYIFLGPGEEISRNPYIPLITSFIGRSSGTCLIKASLNNENPVLSDQFTITDLITATILSKEQEINPGGNFIVEGEAKKTKGRLVEGFVDIQVLDGNTSYAEISDTVTKGYFYVNATMPEGTQAGKYLVKVSVYETDLQGERTNKGFVDTNVVVKQVPTNLEIVFENKDVEPGTNVQVKAILHDQTGQRIESTAIISIKDSDENILEQQEVNIGEVLEYPIKYNEAPSEWIVFAVSNRLNTESTFTILEKEDVQIDLFNDTILITNRGNVPYNKTVPVKIGESTNYLNVSLAVDESKEYKLNAPDGNYLVEVLGVSGEVMLTGNAIEIREVGQGFITLMSHPFVWIFIIVILGLATLIIYRRAKKKSLFGSFSLKNLGKGSSGKSSKSLVVSKNKAIFCLSMRGEKQSVSVVGLKIKNIDAVKKNDGGSAATLQKITDMAEGNKAVTYESGDNLFFLLAPVKTKTFKNEKSALDIAQKAKKIFDEHNKLFKQKIEIGIGVNQGEIVAKEEDGIVNFMAMGTLITELKKIASVSDGDILLSEKIKDKLASDIKVKKHSRGNLDYYEITGTKNREEHAGFISNFIKRLEGDKEKKEEKKED